MDALMDFALVDVTSETTGETPLAPNSQQNQSTATAPLNNQDEMAANHAKLVEDLTLVVEQSLGKFENRLVTRVASEVTQHQQQQQSQSSTPRNAGNGAQSQFGQSPLPLPVHQNVYCDNCNTVIVGVRYKCGMCKDYDLCERCESSRPHQQRNHLFIKIYEPISASLNARPLISNPELARGGDGGNGISAHNPFAGFLSSLGVPAGVHATLEVVHEEEFEIEIRELAQANGCQFYLSDNGQRLCKDYQLINRSSRNIQSGDYYLEHVFSCGLMPLEIHLAVPPIPEGDIRIICLSWRAPQSAVEQSALLLGSDSVAEQDSSNNANDTTNRPPLRQVYSVYRLKDRRGRHIGEPINASLTLMQLAQTAGSWSSGVTSAAQTEADYHHWQHRRVGSNVDDSDENSFELISDDELPSCFVLDSRAPLTPPPVAPTLVPADSAPAQPNNGFDNSNFEDCLSLSDRVHPSMLLAAAYVPKTSNWVPPPQQQQQQPPQPQQKPLPPPPPAPRLLQQQGSLSNLTSSDSSSDIW
uniref:ZZ-type domain-containing protein n=1 Tax=Macrostomum lignano TaxID=282301 RepID=A0A1I8I5X1_9PLAT